MSTITTKDGTEIYYKDWGKGPAVTFSHGWPLNADMWDGQMLFLAQNGFRAIALDRRGHGRSSQATTGNDMNGYADDLAAVIEALDLNDVTVVGHSTGGGEVARYIGRHGTKRVAKAVLIAAVPPIMLKTAANPEGLPIEAFDAIRAGLIRDRSQFYKDLRVRKRQGLLGDRFHRGSEEVRRPDTGASRRGRPDRSRERLGEEVGPAHQGRQGRLLSGRAARHHGHAPGSDQRRAPRVPAGLRENVTARRPHDGRSIIQTLKGFAMKVVIIGGSGLIGSKLVARLREQGHDAVPASPDSGVNTLTGEGLAKALEGANVVVDVSNSPSFEDAAVLKFFQTSTGNLLAAEAAAGVGHHVALSVVGSDRAPDSGYLRAKVAQEKLIAASRIPYTIIRSTQFFEFLKRIADEATDGNTVRIAPVLFQPIAADDVAKSVARVAVSAQVNGIVEIAGPQQFRFEDWLRQSAVEAVPAGRA